MEENILEKAARVLEFYYKVTHGNTLEKVEDGDMLRGLASAKVNYEKLNIKSTDEYIKIRSYLNEGGYIAAESTKVRLKSKGIEEVVKGFPSLKPALEIAISSVNELFIKIDENTEEVLEKIKAIKNMEKYLEDISHDIEIIRLKLEKILPDIEDEDLHDIAKKIINSPNIASALIEIFRLITHPKITAELKKIVTSEDSVLSLPPRSQI